MKTANVSRLKAHLSEYLRTVKRGETVVVHERDKAIAKIVPISHLNDDFVILGRTAPPAKRTKIVPVRPKAKIDIVKILRRDRDSR